jgi:hypothetical protein
MELLNPSTCSPFRIKELQFCKVRANKFAKSFNEKQLSIAALSYGPTFIIGLVSTGRLIWGRALVHSRPSKDARLRDRFRVADHTAGNQRGWPAALLDQSKR